MRTLLTFAACTFLLACGGTTTQTNSTNTNVANTSVSANAPADNSAVARSYPKSAADAFLESCENAGSDGAFCTCVFQKVQAKYTFEEFSVIESKLVAGTPPEEFVEFTGKARAECTK